MAIVEAETTAHEAPARAATAHARELSGLDALESSTRAPRRIWSQTWPKLAAVALALVIWQAVVWSHWKPDYALPGPTTVLPRLRHELGRAVTWRAIATTMRRAAVGFAVATFIGSVVGLAVARVRLLRTAVGSMITGLQTMPSITWFPLALLLFQQSEGAITFVVVIGAAPAIANGLISGIDHIPPILDRAGRAMGATGWRRHRHVTLPAAVPSYVGGLKQGWAFAWRSLMAGELLVIIANRPSIGSRIAFEQDFADASGLIAWMIVIVVIGVLVDAVLFGVIERGVRRRRGLVGQ
jgi:NitT/TauT family transport system permease protein